MTDEVPIPLARALRQELQGWRRAGLTHLPMAPRKPTPPANTPKASAMRSFAAGSRTAQPTAAAPRTTPAKTAGPIAAAQRTPAASVPVAPRKGHTVESTAATASTAITLPVLALPAAPSPHPARSRADREWRLDQLRQRVAACVRCQDLAASRTQTVFGVGNPEARIMLIGEAPGADEDAQGIPFVGQAGQLMDKIIVASGLKREELYICNVLRCRPPGNRKPSPAEAANCREYLDGQIAVIDPEFIICWGATAAQNLLATEETIGRLRGRFFHHGRAIVLCTYHPSYLLRNPAAKKDVWEDMKLFLKEAGLPVPAGP